MASSATTTALREDPALYGDRRETPNLLAVLTSAPMEPPPDQRMSFWIGLAARKAREEAGVVRSQIAGPLGIDQSTVTRFETTTSWPDKTGIDELLTVYAELSGVEDPRDIWERALKMWRGGATGSGEAGVPATPDALGPNSSGRSQSGSGRGKRGNARGGRRRKSA